MSETTTLETSECKTVVTTNVALPMPIPERVKIIKSKKPTKKEKRKEIIWNIVNSTLAGGLVLAGAFVTNSELTQKVILTAISASLIVAITKFKQFWENEKKEYKAKGWLFSFFP